MKKEPKELTVKEEFPKRLKFLMDNHNPKITHKALADAIGSERQNISAYLRGVCLPKAGAIAEIAAFFSVSTDWLLGVNQKDVASGCPNEVIISTMEEATGLSKKACHALVSRDVDTEVISRLIEHGESIDALNTITDTLSSKRKRHTRREDTA